jgi:hypothetical protein
MPQRTQVFRQVPWIGGVNTSVDSGVLNPQELTRADNVVFTATGARIKREGFIYLDPSIPNPDFRSSSGTTRTLTWTTNALVNITPLNERLVVGEHISVAGETAYTATDVPILSRNEIKEVSSVTCVADVSGSLAGKYFEFSAGDSGTNYYAWYKVSGTGSDPLITNRIGVEVDIATNDTATTIASSTSTAINTALSATVAASASSATVTLTNVIGGLTTSGNAGTSGFTFTVTTKGGHSITFTGSTSLTENLTAITDITITKTSNVLSYTDFWTFNGTVNDQYGVYATDNFQLFALDPSNRRSQIHGQEQVTQIVCTAASTLTSGHYWVFNGPNNQTNYYVWYNIASAGGNPAPSGRTGIEVDLTGSETDAQVATATAAAIGSATSFTTSVSTNTITMTAPTAGITNASIDSNTGFTITTTFYGATLPSTSLETVRTLPFNTALLIALSGLGNLPIYYDPGYSTKYQLLVGAPDMSILWDFQSRVWGNDKTDPDRVNYSPPFDQTTWGGVGDSGDMYVGAGDGDPRGITNGYKYKDFMVVAKLNHRYRITGYSPDDWTIQAISDGLGCEGDLFIPVDEQDVVFLSHRGIHSQAATDNYGDTESAYLSAKIKPTFNTWNPAQLKYSQGAWVPELNSFAISVAEEGNSLSNAVWLYNVQVQLADGTQGAWYRWPNVSCTALSKRYTGSKYKFIFGTKDGRIIQAQQENSFSDFGTAGIPYNVKSGTIYVDNDPQTMKAFKKVTLLYRPQGNFSFSVSMKIDNFPSQGFNFNQISGLDLLGETFILGSSLLGSSATLAPFTFSMEGVGRGVVMEITQPSQQEQIEVWGYMIEWEPAGLVQEVV